MKISELLKRLKEIEKEQGKIENKYYLDNKGFRPTWTKKDTAKFSKLRKEQRKLIGMGHGDILTSYTLTKLIVKLMKCV